MRVDIATWLFTKTHRSDGPVDEWQGVTLAKHVQLAMLNARRLEVLRNLDMIDREIAELEASP